MIFIHRNTQEYSDKRKLNDTGTGTTASQFSRMRFSVSVTGRRPYACPFIRKELEENFLDSKGELNADVDVTGHLDDLGELDGLLGGGLEVLDGEDLQAGLVDLWVKGLAYCSGRMLNGRKGGLSYQLVSLLHVGTLETGNDGSAQTHVLDNVDETLGDGVAADDTTEDVDEDSRDLGVAGDELESGLDSSGGSTTADVEEVSGATAVQLDDVHGGHGETSTVDQAANVTVKLDEVQTVLGSLDLIHILLGGIAPREDLLLAELGVLVEAELGVHGQDLVVGGLGQGVDLDLGGITLHEDLVQVLDGGLGILDALLGETEVGSDGAGDVVGNTLVDIDGGGDDGIGVLLGDGLDVHTTLGGGHDDGGLGGTVHEDGEVELATGELALADQDGVARAASGAGLLGDEVLADHLAGEHLGLGRTKKEKPGVNKSIRFPSHNRE